MKVLDKHQKFTTFKRVNASSKLAGQTRLKKTMINFFLTTLFHP